MNANNVTCWIRGDGFFSWNIKSSWNGEFPKGSGVGNVFSEGIVFGRKVHDGVYAESIRVTGTTYFVGMPAGAIQTDASGKVIGTDNPSDIRTRPYAVRPDLPPTLSNDSSAWPDLTMDASTFLQKPVGDITKADKQQIVDQYIKDWMEWPAKKGAPWFVDSLKIVRNDASFDPTNPHHIPGIPEAAKTIWLAFNDLNPNVSYVFAGSPPIGMEEQMTLWAYNNLPSPYGPLNNVIYKQVKLIYKGNPDASSMSHIDSMTICQWVDGDITEDGNDLGGCDSSLSLGFEFSAKTINAKYTGLGLTSPAVGYAFLQGTSVYTGNSNDSAIINFQWRKGYKYWYDRPMTSFFLHQTNTAIGDPDDANYHGTLQWFNLMRSCFLRHEYPAGEPFCSGYEYALEHNIVSKYILSGDPFTKQGWIDGVDIGAGDRRFLSMHGPFPMKLHDTVDVVIAHVEAFGANNLWSIEILKYYFAFAKYLFNGMVIPSSGYNVYQNQIHNSFTLSQNFPNPFNPTTEINFYLLKAGNVTLKVYDILGREVATLVNKYLMAGAHKAIFDASKLTSGIYLYKIQANGSTAVKKMIFMK